MSRLLLRAEVLRLDNRITDVIDEHAEDYNRLVRDQTQVWLRHDAFLDLGFWGRVRWLAFGTRDALRGTATGDRG